MVELSETVAILSNATAHSLILLDEIGRGTSTYDGMSIAAVAEYIHDRLKSRTLFATHYHELTELAARLPNMSNFHVEIADSDNEVRFLYTLAQGACLKSFGIEVAKLSGLPASVLERAHEVLMRLESNATAVVNGEPAVVQAVATPKAEPEPRADRPDQRSPVHPTNGFVYCAQGAVARRRARSGRAGKTARN